MEKVNIAETLALFNDYWNPRIVAELNDQQVKVVKLKGSFVWHHHAGEDEMFLVVEGILRMEFRHRVVELGEGRVHRGPAGRGASAGSRDGGRPRVALPRR